MFSLATKISLLGIILVTLTGCPEVPVTNNQPSDRSLACYEEERSGDFGQYESGTAEYVAALEQQAHDLINRERAAAGLSELFFDPCVTRVARSHSENMAEYAFFAHTCPAGGTPADRLNEAEIPWRRYGENIAYTYGFSNPAEAAVQGWMNSSGHRKNILNSRYTHAGLGIAMDAKGALYFTQNFVGY